MRKILGKNGVSREIPWWSFVLGIDIFLLVIALGKYYLPGSILIQFLVNPFNLAVEMNLAVWWSGLCIAIAGLLSYELFSKGSDQSRYAWLALSIILLSLSLDEVGSLHERASGWNELVPYALIYLFLSAFFFFTLIRISKLRFSVILITLGFVLYASVALQEYIEHLVTWPEWMLGIRLVIEEGTELFATFLILYAVVLQREKNLKGISAIIPNLHYFNHTFWVLLVGIVIYIAVYFSFPSLQEITKKGNPLVWYPMLLFILLFSLSHWNSQSSFKGKLIWKLFSILMLACSAGLMWNILKFFPFLNELIPGRAFYFLLYFVAVCFIFTLFLEKNEYVFYQIIFKLILPISALALCLLYYTTTKNFTIVSWSIFSTLYAYCLFLVLNKLNYSYEKIK